MTEGFLDLLIRLHDAGAEFVIVGGVAAALHGGSRVTGAVNLCAAINNGREQAFNESGPKASSHKRDSYRIERP